MSAASPRTGVRWGRLTVLVLAVAMSAASVPALAEPPTSKRANEIKLGLDDARFWEGEGVERAQVPDPALCGIAGPCWDYPIHVKKDGGSRLRVALSAHFRDPQDVRPWADFSVAPENIYEMRILGPDGVQVASGSSQGSSLGVFTAYSAEVLVDAPHTGVYTVRVIPVSVLDMTFRMRAKLEGAQQPADPTAYLSPNLRIIPPFEVSFSTPTATYGPGAPAADPPAACMAEEVEEAIGAGSAPPELCLRYSMGFENAGDGAFGVELAFPCPLAPEDATACRFHQRRFRSDGKFQDEPSGSAGVGRWHASHAHWHYENTYEFQLLSVAEGWAPGNREPQLDPVGPGRKLGVMPGSELMADWHRFYQGDRDTNIEAAIGLQSGWGDIYEWNRSGNYADFPHNSGRPRAGFYVLRGVTDPRGLIIESNEGDNVGYALISVGADGGVDLLERGRGTDPWDPSKIVISASPG